jgi:RNA polymerase sigma-70 factor (sigma-E family)
VAALFRDHHGELVRLALLMVGDLPTAEDVVQDVYASLHRRSRDVTA